MMSKPVAPLLMGLLSLVAASAVAWWALVTPDNLVTRFFRREITNVDARVVIGPYPGESDFRLLKQNGVGLVVSLLDPAIPYEATLLEREKAEAHAFGIRLLNFPMSSILGRKFGNDYDESASKAAAAIGATTDKVYLHCYLGVHRVKVVQDLLAAAGVNTGPYVVRTGERDAAARALDSADAAYKASRYQEVLDLLARIDENLLTPSARLLRAWAHYRIGHIGEARTLFESFLALAPDHPDATTGLAYCQYRDGRLTEAERLFRGVLEQRPADADALGGLGLTLLRSGHPEEAAAHLDQALKIAPDNQELRDALAHARETPRRRRAA
jgi:tetratricopeptide (TPR) repeat protein